MRFLVKVTMSVDAGNESAREGFRQIPSILEELEPEAVYFYEENGERTGLLVVDLEDVSQIPAVAEPWYLAYDAAVEFHPAMTPEDLQKAGPAVKRAVEKYG